MAEQKDTGEGIHLVIIGAGLAGLAAALSTKLANPAHEVTVLEAVDELQEIGAGLQITPNGTRLLSHWGLAQTLAPLAAVPTSLSVRRYDGTKLLAHEPDLQGQVHARYGHAFWDLHRVDLHRAMAARCGALGVDLRLGARAVRVEFESAVVHLHDGAAVRGDVVLLADGLWSAIRPQFVGRPSPAILTGDLAYRVTVRREDIEGDEELREWVARPTVNFWIGPKAHCAGYSVRGGDMYNLVFLCPDDLPSGVVKLEGDMDEVRKRFAGWDPLLGRFLKQARGPARKWRLMWLDALPDWANDAGTFFMAGDCCHPMLPYLAQGANSSLEDGAVLGSLLGRVKKSEKGRQLPCVSKLYQELRQDRGWRIQLETFKQRDDSHMGDGERQERRDALMLSMLGKEVKAPFPSRWTCPEVQAFLYGYDAYAEAERAYREKPF
ncbi:3-hydroxybenzoate 6-hydroxylase [Madurella mycetomatis]|uniref:3-hydroxybenzoate 6-hydroxylase n=1 Tax=Madurella mycetomatis TaxID=100816 RepID=A0A175VY95_9PEZI|nr:3-hydroxybenzoate 6-hydroxylase [Madurella mycetomatis]